MTFQGAIDERRRRDFPCSFVFVFVYTCIFRIFLGLSCDCISSFVFVCICISTKFGDGIVVNRWFHWSAMASFDYSWQMHLFVGCVLLLATRNSYETYNIGTFGVLLNKRSTFSFSLWIPRLLLKSQNLIHKCQNLPLQLLLVTFPFHFVLI